MKLIGILVAVVTSALMLIPAEGHCAEPESQPSVPLPPELARILTDYESAWQAKDEKALAALFAENGYVLSSGRPPVKGRARIEERYKGSGGPLSLRAFAYGVEGSVGYILGGFARHKGGPDVGKFTLTVVKDAKGHWLIMSDMDNGNQR